MSKSGTLSYESGFRLAQRRRRHFGVDRRRRRSCQRLRYADLVPFYAADEGTDALLLIGEIGGTEEEDSPRH